jgi:hypothetical protein
MRDLDEKWIAKISHGHSDSVEFLLSKNRGCKPRKKEEAKGSFNSKPD